jgi:hypothetical protein
MYVCPVLCIIQRFAGCTGTVTVTGGLFLLAAGTCKVMVWGLGMASYPAS